MIAVVSGLIILICASYVMGTWAGHRYAMHRASKFLRMLMESREVQGNSPDMETRMKAVVQLEGVREAFAQFIRWRQQ